MKTRINQSLEAFSSIAQSGDRLVFGDNFSSDDINTNMNSNWKEGWRKGLDSNNYPTMQNFNSAMYTSTYLTSYLYQEGIAEYSSSQKYYEGSICKQNGVIYTSKIGTAASPNVNKTPSTSPSQWEISSINGISYTQGSVLFAGTDGKPNEDNGNLFWDNVNKRLGIGTTNPATKLEVVGDIYVHTSANKHVAHLISETAGNTHIGYHGKSNYISHNVNGLTMIRSFNPSTSSYEFLFTVTNSKVGIGTDNPTEKLDVRGNIKANDATDPQHVPTLRQLEGGNIDAGYSIGAPDSNGKRLITQWGYSTVAGHSSLLVTLPITMPTKILNVVTSSSRIAYHESTSSGAIEGTSRSQIRLGNYFTGDGSGGRHTDEIYWVVRGY